MVREELIKLDVVYKSNKIDNQPHIEYDKNSRKRPSWVKIKLDKEIIFIKILFNGESFLVQKIL